MKKIFSILILVFFATFLFADDVVFEKGNIRIVLHEYSGSVSLYGKTSRTGKFISLIDNTNYSVTSGFYLKIDDVFRKLERTYDIDIFSNFIEDGVSVSYEIKKQAIVEVQFKVFASNLSSKEDCIKIDVIIKNLTEKPHNYTIKTVFDTLLGEASKNHFFTNKINPLNTEQLFEGMSEQRYVASTNGYDTVGFLLYGNNMAEPEFVCVGNRDTLVQKVWIPNIVQNKTFDSIDTFNNSALSIIWRPIELSSLNKSTTTFFISTATEKRAFPLEKSFPVEMLTYAPALEEDTAIYKDSYGVTYTVGVHSEEQLDPEYIADLLNRIHNLEIKADGSNRDEIKKLNAELDAIMQKVKRIKSQTNAEN